MLTKKSSYMIRTALLVVLCIFPFRSDGDEKPLSIHTIQIISYRNLEDAHTQFDAIVEKLEGQNLEYLRIEKVGDFYPLRLGKFESMSEARRFLQSVRSGLPSSMVMKAYYIEDRIERIYRGERTVEEAALPIPQELDRGKLQHTPALKEGKQKETGERKPPERKKIEEVKLPPVKKPDEIESEAPLEEKIAAISGLVHNKKYDSALKIIKKEIKVQPGNAELNAWYGTVLLKKDRPEEALPYLENAAELSPSVPDYHNALGYCYFYLAETDKAIDAFDKALSLEPEYIDALAGLGIIYAKGDDKDKARDVYNRLKNLDRDSADKLMKIIEETP